MTGRPIDITEVDFHERVVQARIPALVDFWAPWCRPCLMMSPIFEELAAEHEGRLLVAKVNVEKNKTLAGRYGVYGVPTVLFLDGGGVVGRTIGAVSKETLDHRLERMLGPPASA